MALKGKQLTLLAKILAALIVLVSLIVKAAGRAPGLSIDDALKVGAFIAVIFAPVDASLLLEKFTSTQKTDATEVPHG